MAAALLVLRVLLAAVFLVAGVAKLADSAGSREAVAGFGVPERLAGIAGRLLPLAELCVAVALVPTASARFGAIGAAVLLLTFIAAIGNALARGRAPDCHCFGQVHSAPAGRGTLMRNGVLLAVAGFVAIGGWNDAGASATHWVTQVSTTWLVAAAAGLVIVLLVAFQVWFSLQLLSQNGRALGRLEALESTVADLRARLAPAVAIESAALGAGLGDAGLGIGSPAPPFTLPGIDGQAHTLESLVEGRRRLMFVFSDADCGPCNALLPEVAEWQQTHGDRLGFVVIASGEPDRNRAKASEHGLDLVLLEDGREVAEAFRARLTPAAVVVGADRRVESPVVAGVDAIRALVAQAGSHPAVGRPTPAAEVDPRVGHPAPALHLPGLDGRQVELADLYRDRTLAIFWNPECGFCQQMLPDLKALERDPPAGAPQLLVISGGSAEQMRADGLRSRVVLDPDSEAMRAFAASGTPMGVLVEDGRIASPLAAGAAAVLELAGVRVEMPQIVHAGGGGHAR
jgi:peroxiredoxin/uncharacterized membrane protein YphA (DoxX/SURF4 family)